MNPAIVIPTYHTVPRAELDGKPHPIWDHATSLDEPGELARCLESLQKVEGLGQVILLVAADEEIAPEAEAKVHEICRSFPDMHTLVIGRVELTLIRQRLNQHGFELTEKALAFDSYGAVRNLGLMVCNILGFDACIFVDDDEVVEDSLFLHKAVYGLGKLTKRGIPVLAKSGFYFNDEHTYHSKRQSHWYNHYWDQGSAFNKWIDKAMEGPRLSRSNHVCGGCLALHHEAYKRVSFDPWITRGEDLDYLLCLRMYGSDIWFDNEWSILHLPPDEAHEGERFRRDVYRWLYEYAKIEFSHSQIDLMQIKPSSLMPYPGPFLQKGIQKRIARTASLRALACGDKLGYAQAAEEANGIAARAAEQNCRRHFDLQREWPEMMHATEDDAGLKMALVQAAVSREAGETVVVAPSEAPEPEAVPEPEVAPAAEEAAPVEEAPRYVVPDASSLNTANINVDPGRTGEIHLNMGE